MISGNKRKMLIILIAAVLGMSLMTGCGSKPTETPETGAPETGADAPVTLRFAWWGNQVRNDLTQKANERYHELNGNVSVQGSFYQWSDYWSKMATQSAGKQMPDIIQMDLSHIDQYVSNNQLLDLTPYIESGALDTSKIPENILVMGKVGEGNYGIAAGVNVMCLFYDKAITDSVGVTIEDNMTFDAFVEVAKKITAETGYRAKLIYDANYMRDWARAEGISIQKAEMPVDSADAYVPYFQILVDGVAEGWHTTPDVMTGNAIEMEPLVYGSTPETMSWCTLNGGSNQLTALQKAAKEGQKITVSTIPTSDPIKSNYLKPSMFFSISADTKNPDAAVAFLNYLINSVEANEILLGERGVPINTDIADFIYDKITPGEQEVIKFVTEVVTPNSSPIDPPDPKGSSELNAALRDIVEKVGYGEYSAEEAAQEYFTRGTEIFAESNK